MITMTFLILRARVHRGVVMSGADARSTFYGVLWTLNLILHVHRSLFFLLSLFHVYSVLCNILMVTLYYPAQTGAGRILERNDIMLR